MAAVTLTSTCDTNLSQTLAYKNSNTHLCDASSPNLSNAVIPKLAEPTQNPSPTINAPQDSHSQIGLERKKAEGEAIFSAERYFNGGTDEGKPRTTKKEARNYHPKKDEESNLHQMNPKFRPRTPSNGSEVSSNSQNSLLPCLSIHKSPSKQNRVHGKKFFARFGCNCSCSDKKSVNIDVNVAEIKNSKNYRSNVDCGEIHSKEFITKEIKKDQDPISSVGTKQTHLKEEFLCQNFDKIGIGLNGEECITIPVPNSTEENLKVKSQLEEERKVEEKPRNSLELFRSPVPEKGQNLNLQRRFTKWTWDSIPRAEDIPATSGGGGAMYEDNESDISSDLFEIESLSGNAHPPLPRPASDPMSSCVTPTRYEPSEATIDWSVVTASAANVPAVSGHGERPPTAVTKNSGGITPTTTAKTTTAKGAQRRRPNMLSGCRSEKAVKVAGDALRVSEKAKSRTRGWWHRSDPLVPMGRFQAETKVRDFGSANGQRAFGTRALSRSASAQ